MAVKTYSLSKGLYASGILLPGIMSELVSQVAQPKDRGDEGVQPPGMKTYMVPKGPRNATLVFLSVMALAGLAALPMFLRFRSLFVVGTYAAFALAVVLGWYQTLGRVVTEITVRVDKTIEFKSALRRGVLLPHEITAVRTFDTDDDGTRTLIEHRRGKVDISHIADVGAIVSLLKAQHPRIKVIDERTKAASSRPAGGPSQ